VFVRETRSDAKNENAAQNASGGVGGRSDGGWADAGAFGVQRQCRKQRTRRIGCSLSSIRAQRESERIAVRGCSRRGLGLNGALAGVERERENEVRITSSRARPKQNGRRRPHLSDFTVQLSKPAQASRRPLTLPILRRTMGQQNDGAQQPWPFTLSARCRRPPRVAHVCPHRSRPGALPPMRPQKSRWRTLGMQTLKPPPRLAQYRGSDYIRSARCVSIRLWPSP
jgi:hypothetical protein